MTPESFLALGYEVPIAAHDAVEILLQAARSEALVPERGPARLGLPSAAADSLPAQIDLHVQGPRGRYDGHAIAASRPYTADIDDLQEIERVDLTAGDDQQRLTWALTALGQASLAEDEPRWLLGMGLQVSASRL